MHPIASAKHPAHPLGLPPKRQKMSKGDTYVYVPYAIPMSSQNIPFSMRHLSGTDVPFRDLRALILRRLG